MYKNDSYGCAREENERKTEAEVDVQHHEHDLTEKGLLGVEA